MGSVPPRVSTMDMIRSQLGIRPAKWAEDARVEWRRTAEAEIRRLKIMRDVTLLFGVIFAGAVGHLAGWW